MTTTSPTIAPAERLDGQGLDANQEESGNRAIHRLLTDEVAGRQTDFVATYRDGAYEVWSGRGMIRFQRVIEDGGFAYPIIEQIGENPIENQDPDALATCDEEDEAARRSGKFADDPNQRWIDPEALSYPYGYERLAQLFDSPNAPDLVHNPLSYTFGRSLGQHGSLDVVQSRAPLIFSGPGVPRGEVFDEHARQVDIAPTIARLLGWPLIEGEDITGRISAERSAGPDVYFARQDGKAVEILDDGTGRRAERVYIILLDGVSNTELLKRMRTEESSLPHLRSLIAAGSTLACGSIANFPSITWPSHNALGTSCYGGHHDIVNPTYYLREERKVVTPQGQQFETAHYLNQTVETIYEAFHRVYGHWSAANPDGAFTASINEPCTRGADHATLERILVGDRIELKRHTVENSIAGRPRWEADENQHLTYYTAIDNRATGQVVHLFNDPSHPAPKLVYHEFGQPDAGAHDYGPHSEGFRDAMDETDERVGIILDMLKQKGLFEGTLFVITSDHGMAAQDIEQAADPPMLLKEAGLACEITSPLIYLLDMDVQVMRSGDGRNIRVAVFENDADESGEKPPLAGARVTLFAGGEKVAEAESDVEGWAGLPISVEFDSEDCLLLVEHDNFNPRHLRATGENVLPDLREILYGGQFEAVSSQSRERGHNGIR
ncbi:MAG: alkaline phosphatase family protein [Dehalococcoidia bacterium]